MKSPSLLETRVREYTALLRERVRLEALGNSGYADELAEVSRRILEMQQAAEFLPKNARLNKFIWDEDDFE